MTISSVAPAIVTPAGALGGAASGSTTEGTENGSLFAGILDLGTRSETAPSLLAMLQEAAVPATAVPAVAGVVVESSTTDTAPAPADVLGAAQIMAAAQVVPVTPVLAFAVSLQLAARASAAGGASAAGASAAGASAAGAASATTGPVAGVPPLAEGDATTTPVATTPVATTPVAVPVHAPVAVPVAAVASASPVMGSSAGSPLATPAAEGAVAPAVATAPGVTPTVAAVVAPVPALGSAPAPDSAAPAPDSAAPVAAPPVAEKPGAPRDESATPAPAPAPASAPDLTQATVTTSTTAHAQHAQPDGRHHQGRPRPEPGVETTAPVAATSSAAAATAPTAPMSATAAVARPEAPSHVTSQVFPEIARMTSRSDGTRRITIKLSPEALGDVQVTLTVRNGEVHVRMLGSDLAQQALRAGAPELQRLLESTGATSSQVVVGDQGSSPDSGWQSSPGQSGHGTDRQTDPHQDHRTAGTRNGDTSARDGKHGGPQPRSSTDPTAIRGAGTLTHPGVDVSM